MDYRPLFEALTAQLDQFVQTVHTKKLSLQATDEWTVKGVLCHIVFWHEAYAANYGAMANHAAPQIPQSPAYKLNESSVKSMKRISTDILIKRLWAAHESLRNSIVIHTVPEMTYNSGGRVYKTDEFLEMITRHIRTHMIQVRRAK